MRSMLPERIRTSRLVLRCQREADAALVKEAIDASLAHLKKSVGWARHSPTPVEVLAERLAASAAAFHAGAAWTYSIFEPSETQVLGAVALEPADPALVALVGQGAFELGYWLRASAVGLGYATEATVALVEAALRHLSATRVAICHDPTNTASAGVPRRAGFRCLGVVPSSTLPGREAADGSLRPATQVWLFDAGRV